jgi:hypothetical protein
MSDQRSSSSIVDPSPSNDGHGVTPSHKPRPVSGLLDALFRPFDAIPPILIAVVILVLLVAVAIIGLPRLLTPKSPSATPAVESSSPCPGVADCAILVHFSAPVDRNAVADDLAVTPPTTLVVAWRDDQTLAIRPAPLLPTVSYTVRITPVAPPPRGINPPTPVLVSFVARNPGTAVELVTPVVAPSPAPPATPAPQPTLAPPTQVPTVAPTPTTALAPTAIIASVAAPTPPILTPAPNASPVSACAIAPVRGFGLLYGSDPTLAGRLGCAHAAEIANTAVVQQFEGGQLLRRGDRPETFVLTADGHWAHYTDVASDAATPSPSSVRTSG